MKRGPSVNARSAACAIGAANLVFESASAGNGTAGLVNGINIDTVTGGSITVNGAVSVTKSTGDSIRLNANSSAFTVNGTTTRGTRAASIGKEPRKSRR